MARLLRGELEEKEASRVSILARALVVEQAFHSPPHLHATSIIAATVRLCTVCLSGAHLCVHHASSWRRMHLSAALERMMLGMPGRRPRCRRVGLVVGTSHSSKRYNASMQALKKTGHKDAYFLSPRSCRHIESASTHCCFQPAEPRRPPQSSVPRR